jgi:hypothetical protein
MACEARPLRQVHHPETARVVEAHDPAVLGLHHDVIVGLAFHLSAPMDEHAPGHAEMGEKDGPVLHLDQEILRAALDLEDAAPFQAPRESRRQREAQIRPVLPHAHQAAALQPCGQAPADGFNLGQFGHGGRSSADRRRGAMVSPP